MNRRAFLIGAGAGLSVLGANQRINVGVIGIRGRGRDHIAEFVKLPNARVAAVCDIDDAQNERAIAFATKQQQGLPPRSYRDLRKLL